LNLFETVEKLTIEEKLEQNRVKKGEINTKIELKLAKEKYETKKYSRKWPKCTQNL